MPSGLRYVVKVGKKMYNLSPLQWELLQKKSVKLSGEWTQERSIRGLIKQRLFTNVEGKAVKSDLGAEVTKAIKAKIKSKDSKA